ncbi:MAG: exonuclease domain-containing protein [Alphaproteobacteria bacterium]|nr:exonuclease domain-containing protein [Alphaproteobacteria bacterium]
MKSRQRKHAVVFDLEFTAWEGSMRERWTRPGERKEVVQIGAVKLDAERLAVVDEFEMLVAPRINPVLSDYLVTLTGISNARLAERGVDFITALGAFLDFVGDAALWAFGRDDLVLAENLKLYGWEAMALPKYHNAVPWLNAQGLDLTGKNACDVAQAAGIAFDGQRHDALADAAGVVAGMVHLIKNGAVNPFLPGPPP